MMRWMWLVLCLMLWGSGSWASVVVTGPVVMNDCSQDVTRQLNTFFAGLESGSPSLRVIVQLSGCYRIDGTVVVPQRHYVTIQGPAVLRAYAPMVAGGSRAILQLDRGDHLRLRELTLHGTNPDRGPYDGRYEHEYGLQIAGSSAVEIDRALISNTRGDGISINPGGNWSANGTGATLSDDIQLTYSEITSTGRHGLTITAGSRLQVMDTTFDDIGYLAIDAEVEAPAWSIRKVVLSGNTFGHVRIGAFSASGFRIAPFAPEQLSDLLFVHNTVTGPVDTCIAPVGFTVGSSPMHVTIFDNRITSIGSPFFVSGGTDITIAGNYATGNSCGAGGAGVTLDGGADIMIDRNVFPNAPAAWRLDTTPAALPPTDLVTSENTCRRGVACPLTPGF